MALRNVQFSCLSINQSWNECMHRDLKQSRENQSDFCVKHKKSSDILNLIGIGIGISPSTSTSNAASMISYNFGDIVPGWSFNKTDFGEVYEHIKDAHPIVRKRSIVFDWLARYCRIKHMLSSVRISSLRLIVLQDEDQATTMNITIKYFYKRLKILLIEITNTRECHMSMFYDLLPPFSFY